MMFHWHADTFDVPRLPAPAGAPPPPAPPPPTGSVLLSSSKLCRNQAFRFKNRLFGFQYHIEFTPEDIAAVVAADPENAARAGGAEKVIAETAKLYSRHARLGDRILQNFVQFLKLY
jgi:GMP synthase-like glutamine amidotransferase